MYTNFFSWELLSITQFLTITVIAFFLLWLIQYHFKRQRLYKLASKILGPTCYPIVGSIHLFFGRVGGESYFLLTEFLKISDMLVETYGGVLKFWLGNRLMIALTKPKDLEFVMSSPYALNKGSLYKFWQPAMETGLLTAPVAKWKRHRRMIMPAFNQNILDTFVDTFAKQAEILNDQLRKEDGNGIFDLFPYLSRCTLDIICESAMGIKVNAQVEESLYMEWLNRIIGIVFERTYKPWYYLDVIFKMSSAGTEFYNIIDKMQKFACAVIKDKREDYVKKMLEAKTKPKAQINNGAFKRKAFLELLMELSEDGTKFTDEELREEVNTFLIAGSDTTATTNCFVLIMLALYPEIQRKVYEEVMDVLGPTKDVEASDLPKFQYLEMVIQETLRIFPVAPIVARAITEDIQISEGYVIPEGSSVICGIIYAHRDPDIWPDPMKFDPERFLPENGAQRHPYAFLPFSRGPRNCIGMKFAMMSMKGLLATVIRRNEFTTDYKCLMDIDLKLDIVLMTENGYRVAVKTRNVDNLGK